MTSMVHRLSGEFEMFVHMKQNLYYPHRVIPPPEKSYSFQGVKDIPRKMVRGAKIVAFPLVLAGTSAGSMQSCQNNLRIFEAARTQLGKTPVARHIKDDAFATMLLTGLGAVTTAAAAGRIFVRNKKADQKVVYVDREVPTTTASYSAGQLGVLEQRAAEQALRGVRKKHAVRYFWKGLKAFGRVATGRRKK